MAMLSCSAWARVSPPHGGSDKRSWNCGVKGPTEGPINLTALVPALVVGISNDFSEPDWPAGDFNESRSTAGAHDTVDAGFSPLAQRQGKAGGSLRDGTWNDRVLPLRHIRIRGLSWVEEFFSGCLESRFQSSFCLRFSGIRLHQSPNQIHLGSFVTTPNERT